MASTVPPPALGLTGYTAPDEATILAAVTADINTAFGATLNPALSSPQGQLASSLAAIIGDKNNMFLGLTSQVDPAYAQGRMQDAIARIYFLTRIPATPTTVSCVCTGTAGTVIATGAIAKDTLGNLYEAVSGGTISGSGTVTLTFANQITGPVACAAGTLTSIYVAQTGWDTITNAAAGTLGRNVETAQEFELRRSQSVGINSNGGVGTIYAAVAAPESYSDTSYIPSDVLVLENSLGHPAVVRGLTLATNSVYVSVIAPDAATPNMEVAEAIWRTKATGCGTNGATSMTVIDTTYADPKPEYVTRFQHAAGLAIKVAVTVASTSALPSTATSIIKSAVLAALPVRIGADVYAGIFYGPIAVAIPGVSIFSILVGTSAPTDASVAVSPAYYATLAEAGISVFIV